MYKGNTTGGLGHILQQVSQGSILRLSHKKWWDNALLYSKYMMLGHALLKHDTLNTSTVVETFMWWKQTMNEDANPTMMHAPFEDDVCWMCSSDTYSGGEVIAF